MKRAWIFVFILLFIVSSVFAQNSRQRRHSLTEEITVEDIEAELEFGREVAARILGAYPLYEDDKLLRYVNLVGKSLTEYGNRPEIEFTFGILDTDIINAFAAPGGYVFVTRGALESMEDEAQLAAVIGHEIIHVTQKHIVKELNIHGSDSSPVSGFARLVGGATDAAKVALSKAVGEAVNILFNRGYKKKDEVEADSMGVVLASTAGYDPAAAIRFLEKVGEKTDKEKISDLKKLYPPFDERIQLINKTIKDEGLATGNYRTGRKRFNEFKIKKE